MPIILLPVDPWWLKDPFNSANDIKPSLIGDGFNRSRHEDQAVFSPISRSKVVVVADVERGWHFNLHFEFLNDADWNAFQTLRSLQRTLLLQRVYTNDQWYIRLGDLIDLHEASTYPIYRTCVITAEEVDVPTL